MEEEGNSSAEEALDGDRGDGPSESSKTMDDSSNQEGEKDDAINADHTVIQNTLKIGQAYSADPRAREGALQLAREASSAEQAKEASSAEQAKEAARLARTRERMSERPIHNILIARGSEFL